VTAPDVTEGEVAGWPAVTLANELVGVTVLPAKGADIHAFVDVPTGTDVLFKAPWGLQPPGAPPREGSDGAPFLENYEGGWQELFPNANDPCVYRGRDLPFHGEVATEEWEWDVVEQADTALAVRFAVECPRSPLRLERVMRLRPGSGSVELDETVTNLGDEPEQFVWGHHCVLGAPLVGAGAHLRTPARTVVTIPEMWEGTARLEPGRRSAWPHAPLRAGGEVDLSVVPGPEQGSHDDVYLCDLEGGWAEVVNDRLGLGFRLDWDPSVFRWIISWQPYGGAEAMPLRGAYGLGVEPWVSQGNLEQAVAAGTALEVAPGAHLRTTLTASIRRPGG
jgi:Domain of unknown function (DUF4432)